MKSLSHSHFLGSTKKGALGFMVVDASVVWSIQKTEG